MVTALTASTFDETIKNANMPVLVDFWAEWCGPCRMFSPIIDEVAEECSGQVQVCKLNVDEAQEIAIRYNVMSIPTLILFRDGKMHSQILGMKSKEAVKEFIATP